MHAFPPCVDVECECFLPDLWCPNLLNKARQHLMLNATMSSNDDAPLVQPALPVTPKPKRPKKTKGKPKSRPVQHQRRFSKYADMHAKELGHTDSDSDVSEDDRHLPDLSYICGDDEDNDLSDNMLFVYSNSINSQVSMGFGTPMHKKRQKGLGLAGLANLVNQMATASDDVRIVRSPHHNPAPSSILHEKPKVQGNPNPAKRRMKLKKTAALLGMSLLPSSPVRDKSQNTVSDAAFPALIPIPGLGVASMRHVIEASPVKASQKTSSVLNHNVDEAHSAPTMELSKAVDFIRIGDRSLLKSSPVVDKSQLPSPPPVAVDFIEVSSNSSTLSDARDPVPPASEPLSPLPHGFIADSPVSRWEVARRLPEYKAGSPDFRLQVARRLVLSLTGDTLSGRKDAATQTTSALHENPTRREAFSQTTDMPHLTLRDLQTELKAFAIAFGF